MAAVGEPILYILKTGLGVPQLLVFNTVQSDFYDMAFIYAGLQKVPFIDCKEQKGFSAAADAGNHLDHAVFPARNQPFEVYIPFDWFHSFTLLTPGKCEK